MTWTNLAHLLLGAVIASVTGAIKTHVDQFLARRLAAMGLTHHAKNALKIALPHQAANEIIPLLDRLSDEVQAEDRHAAARVAAQPKIEPDRAPAIEPPAPATETPTESEPNPADAPIEEVKPPGPAALQS